MLLYVKALGLIKPMDLSQFNISSEEDRVLALRLQKSRLIRLRWFYVGLLTLVAVVSSLIARQPTKAVHYLVIGSIGLFLNAILYFINKKVLRGVKFTQAVLVLHILIDLGLAAFVTYDQGALQARTTVLFVFPIITAGALFTAGTVYVAAILAGVSYILSILAYAIRHNTPLTAAQALIPIAFYPAFFVILAQLVIYMVGLGKNEEREKAYDNFLALLSHQLKHPSSTANAIIDQLEHGPPTNPKKQAEYIHMLKMENQNLSHLLNNLLETAPSKTKTVSVEIDLKQVIERAVQRSGEANARSQDASLTLPAEPIVIWGNSEKLSTALINVLNNAFQYSKNGTPVKVELRPWGEGAQIIVEDKGSGIDREARRNLFQKYAVRTEGSGGIRGLGLGLYVARKIMEAHNGSIKVETSNAGTQVVINIKGQKHD